MLQSFSAACPEPAGGWTAATAAQYTCSEECARVFVTAYNDCRTSYMERVAAATDEQKAAREMLVGTPESPCRVTFERLIASSMQMVADDSVCGPIYDTCIADDRCAADLRDAWRNTLNDAAEAMFESTICSRSREFRELYECSDNMAGLPNMEGGWQRSSCWERDELPPSTCERIVGGIRDACPAPPGGTWTVEIARSYTCTEDCARAIVGAYHYCGTSFALSIENSPNKDALWTTIDDDPPGPCTVTFSNMLDSAFQALASGGCAPEYNDCMAAPWCRANVRDSIGTNLRIPQAEARFEETLCSKSPEYQQLYQCVDVGGNGEPWRMASCAEPDRLRRIQCNVLIDELKSPESSPCTNPPATAAEAASYQCPDECATKLTTAYWECQTSWFAEVDGWSDEYKEVLFALVRRSPEPGPCAATFQANIQAAIANVAADPECGPKYSACARDLECRRSIGEGIGAMGYEPSRIMFESTVCDRPVEYQELLECAYAMPGTRLEANGRQKPWRRSSCLTPDILPPVFCNYMMDNLMESCPAPAGGEWTPEAAASYDCSADCARALVTVWNYCQTGFYLRSKEWPEEGRLALRALVKQDPPGPCMETFGGLVSERMEDLERDPQCGPLYDVCVADGWCLQNLQDAVRALSNEFTVEGFEDHMCDSRQSEKFRRLYECTDRQRDGAAAWTRAECAAPDVLTPAQCAVLIEQFTPDSAHPACATPADGWNVAAIADYTCSLECAEALTTVWTQCQTSWWHFTDTWDQDGRDTLMAMVDQDPEFPGPCASTYSTWLDSSLAALRDDETCGPKYIRCMRDYGCRTQLREAIPALLSLPSRMNYESDICDKDWQLHELYECATARQGVEGRPEGAWPWTRSRCWVQDKLPSQICTNIFERVGNECAIDGVPWFGQGVLTPETARTHECPVECARGIIDAWNYCQTSFGTYETTVMDDDQKAVWFTLIDWDEASPGPCMATFRSYIDERLAEVAAGPCAMAYNNCVGGSEKGLCSRNIEDAIVSLQSEYAREGWERDMCSTSQSFQWLYQCLRENDVASGQRVDQVSEPWRMSSCAEPDQLTRVQCQNLVSREGLLAEACPAPAGGEWTPEAAMSYECSAECARMLFAASTQCASTFAAYVETWPQANQFSLFLLMNPGPTLTGSCYTARRESVGTMLAMVAADPECGPKYDACFSDPNCRPNIRDGFESLGFGPSRVRFESTVCDRPVAYQELHECTSIMGAVAMGARETGDWSRAWRRVSCLKPDEIPPIFCSNILNNLNVSCPAEPPYNAETGAAYDCSDDCAKSLTTAWNYCQTTFYMRVQEWDADGRAFLLALEAGAPDLASESTKGPCAAKQEALVLDALAAVESDPQCGPLYDACVADSWCLFNMRAAVQALQSEYVRPSFEEKLCDSDKSTAFQRLYECVDRQRDGVADGWNRAACAEPDQLTPVQCSVIMEGFSEGGSFQACEEPAGGWNLPAIYDGYECSDRCANMLTTAYKYCQTSWFSLVLSDTNGWSEEAREVLQAMVSDDPEYPGPCTQTRNAVVTSAFSAVRNDAICGPMYWTCMRDYDCRLELGDAIGATLTPWSKTRYEGEMCSRTWQMQNLYECYVTLNIAPAPPPGAPPARPWRRSRCLAPDKALPPICERIFARLPEQCPDIDTLTPEAAKSAECSEDCARTIQAAWSWCQTSYFNRIQGLEPARREVVWSLIDWDEDEPGPCFTKFRDVVSVAMRAIATGPCRMAYNNCVDGQNRDQCLGELREAIGALATRNDNARTLFERDICQKSRDFQWLYSCARHSDETVADADAWSPSACAASDILSPVQCSALMDDFRTGSLCPLPESGTWNPASARTYTCPSLCAASLMTAFYECPATFARLTDELPREGRLALFIITQGWQDWGSDQKGACTETLTTMVTDGIDQIRADETCGPLYDACFNDLTCRDSIREGIRAGYNVHSARVFEANMCSRPIAYMQLYECMVGMDWEVPEEMSEMAEAWEGYTPWTVMSCVEADKLEPSDCSELMAAVKPACPGSNFLDGETAEEYTCSEGCARALVTVMSQCQSTLVEQAAAWSEDNKAAFRTLVRGGPDRPEESPGPCTEVFGNLVFQGLTQIERDPQCGRYYDACVGRADNWCRSNLRDGIGASLVPASRVAFESTICQIGSPEYQDLYECVSASGFTGADAWTKDQCTPDGVGFYDEEGGWVAVVQQTADGGSTFGGGVLGLLLGLLLGYCGARSRLSRQQGGAYRPVNEGEVRNLIRCDENPNPRNANPSASF